MFCYFTWLEGYCVSDSRKKRNTWKHKCRKKSGINAPQCYCWLYIKWNLNIHIFYFWCRAVSKNNWIFCTLKCEIHEKSPNQVSDSALYTAVRFTESSWFIPCTVTLSWFIVLSYRYSIKQLEHIACGIFPEKVTRHLLLHFLCTFSLRCTFMQRRSRLC